jgi:hypothetical protein
VDRPEKCLPAQYLPVREGECLGEGCTNLHCPVRQDMNTLSLPQLAQLVVCLNQELGDLVPKTPPKVPVLYEDPRPDTIQDAKILVRMIAELSEELESAKTYVPYTTRSNDERRRHFRLADAGRRPGV